MKLSENSQKIYAEFFQDCDICRFFEFPKVQIYSRNGSKILTKILNVEAITFGKHIFVHPKYIRRDEKKRLRIYDKLLAHELVHVLQYQKHGFVRFLKKYIRDFWNAFKKKEKWNLETWYESYSEIPYEIQARKFAADFMHWSKIKR